MTLTQPIDASKKIHNKFSKNLNYVDEEIERKKQYALTHDCLAFDDADDDKSS